MHRKVTKLWLRVSFALLAACLPSMVMAQAVETPSQPGDVSGISAKHVTDRKGPLYQKQEQ